MRKLTVKDAEKIGTEFAKMIIITFLPLILGVGVFGYGLGIGNITVMFIGLCLCIVSWAYTKILKGKGIDDILAKYKDFE